MKKYFRNFAGLAIVVFLTNAALAGASFIEVEENYYRSAVKRQLIAPKDDLIDQENRDKKAIRFALTVYGEYFGSSAILASIDYCIYLKNQNLEGTEEFHMVQNRVKAWGRKSALTIMANSEHFSVANRDSAFQIAREIEGERWKELQNDALYTKTALFWNDASKLKPMDGGGWSIALIEKVIVMEDGKLTIALENGETIDAKGGRATIASGELASCEMSFFTNLPVREIDNARFSGAVAIDNGFGKKLIAWRDGSKDGLVQVIRGRRLNNGAELLVLKNSGLDRPCMSASVTKLSDDDLSVLALRGSSVLDEYARNIDYNNPVSFGRFGSRLDATHVQNILKEKRGDIRNLEPFLVMYANILPQFPDGQEYQAYNDILKRFKQ